MPIAEFFIIAAESGGAEMVGAELLGAEALGAEALGAFGAAEGLGAFGAMEGLGALGGPWAGLSAADIAAITQSGEVLPAMNAAMPETVNLASQMALNEPSAFSNLVPSANTFVDTGFPTGYPSADTFTEPGAWGSTPIDAADAARLELKNAEITGGIKGSGGIFDQAKQWWGGLSPFQKGMATLGTAVSAPKIMNALGGSGIGTNDTYSGPLNAYRLSPNFQGRFADPAQFRNAVPRRYAEGGIASVPSYAKGGNLSDAMDYYETMTRQAQNAPEGKSAPKSGGDVGIYYDTDPDTQRLDPLTAAQVRLAKINARTGMQGQGVKRPTPMGRLNLAPALAKQAQEAQYQDINAARGGIMEARMAMGGPVEQMSNANSVGANTGFPMADIAHGAYATPYQQPISRNVVTGPQDVMTDPFSGVPRMATGGISSLGGYAAGGNPRLLKGPGDGMSDNIPATIGNRQPARLADGEFVVPADVVSHLGNGSTDAGAKKLHQMMTKVRKARTGNPKQGKQINPDKYVPK